MATGRFGGRCVERHSAFVFDRGGSKRIGPLLDLSSVKWERARDNTTEGVVRIEGDACDAQASVLSSLRTHRHELVIYRGRDRVWEGPIHRIASHAGYTEITARDVSEYLFHTPLTQGYSNAAPNQGPTSTRIGNIITFELGASRIQDVDGVPHLVPAWEGLNPPINVLPHMVIHHWPNEAETTAVTLPYEMTVGEHLLGLCRTGGIDFTTVGRAIHIWDVSRSLGRIQALTEGDFLTEVVVTEYGSDHVQSTYVIGQDGVFGGALNPANLDYYGPWTDITTAYNEEGTEEPTQAELISQAKRNLAGHSPVPLEVRVPDNSGLVMTDLLTINKLIPGVQVPLRARLNSRNLAQMQKIDNVVVTENSVRESVQVTLTPTTRPDDDEEPES